MFRAVLVVHLALIGLSLTLPAIAVGPLPVNHPQTDRTGYAGDASCFPCHKSQNQDRKSTRLNSSHLGISYAVFCLKKKKNNNTTRTSAIIWSKLVVSLAALASLKRTARAAAIPLRDIMAVHDCTPASVVITTMRAA